VDAGFRKRSCFSKELECDADSAQNHPALKSLPRKSDEVAIEATLRRIGALLGHFHLKLLSAHGYAPA
jgi:hypothetical protein